MGFDFAFAAQAEPASEKLPFLPEWVALWAPHFALTLVMGSSSGRKKVAALCIPLLVKISGGPTHRVDAAYAFSFLLDEVELRRTRLIRIGEKFDSYAGETETLFDRVLWAKLEVNKRGRHMRTHTTVCSHFIILLFH